MSNSSIRPPDPDTPGSLTSNHMHLRGAWTVPPAINPSNIQSYRTHAYFGMILGLLSMLATFVLEFVHLNGGSLLQLFATGFWVYSGSFMAKARGYHPAWGLLGLIGIIGLIILSLFPDRYRVPLDAVTRRIQLAVRLLLVIIITVVLGFVISL